MNKPSVVTLLETVMLNYSRYPEDGYEFDITPEESNELVDYIIETDSIAK